MNTVNSQVPLDYSENLCCQINPYNQCKKCDLTVCKSHYDAGPHLWFYELDVGPICYDCKMK